MKIQFCLKIYDLWRHPHLLIDGLVIWVGSCQITKNQINLDLIEIIQFWTVLLKPLQPFTGLFFSWILHNFLEAFKFFSL